MPKLSVVVPCYNEELVIDELFKRLVDACEIVASGDFELLFVNDGSVDGTWNKILSLANSNNFVVGINLSRNFGHQYALTAGLDICRAERILIIDADLQDPPELLPDMMKLMDGGADVVYGQRTIRNGEGWFKKASASVFYRVLLKLSDIEIPVDTGDFRLIKKKVNKALQAMPEQHRFVRGMVSWLGFRQVAISYERDERFAGETKYPLRKMLRFALDAITGFSISPLRLSVYFSVLFALIAFVMGGYVVFSWTYMNTVPGWASIALLVSLLGAVQLISFGIMGEYVGRTYMESKKRPIYLVDEVASSRTVEPVAQVPLDNSEGDRNA